MMYAEDGIDAQDLKSGFVPFTPSVDPLPLSSTNPLISILHELSPISVFWPPDGHLGGHHFFRTVREQADRLRTVLMTGANATNLQH